MKKKHKIITYCIIGTLAFASQTAVINAEETPIAGIDLVLHNFLQNDENDITNLENYLVNKLANPYKDITFAKVSNYVNIRSTPNEEGEILGKLYNNSAAIILEKSNDWYKVKSGTVTGYIKGEYLVTGEMAETLAKELGSRVALVTTTTLKVREKASTESAVLTLVAHGDELIVKEEKDGWAKVIIEGDKTGFVSTDYVEIKQEYEEAVSIEEEQERLVAEQEAIQAEKERLVVEQKAILAEQRRNTEQADKSNNSQTSNKNVSSNNKSSVTSKKSVSKNENTNTSSIRNKIVEYALRFEGNPYVWGGTSLTNGADCSGFTQSVFRDNGISIPRTSRTQGIGGKRISIEDMQPGDLIFYGKNGTINHVGIYIGNGKVISASSPETGIRITKYNYRQPYRVVSYFND